LNYLNYVINVPISEFWRKVTKILAYIKIFLYLCMIFLKERMKQYIYQDSTVAFVVQLLL